MKYVRRGTPKAPAPAGKTHAHLRPPANPLHKEPVATPQPRDDADQLVHETATEAIQRRIDAVIDHIVTPEPDKPRKQTVKPVKAAKKPANDTKTRARTKSPAKKK